MGSWENPYKTRITSEGHKLLIDEPASGWIPETIQSLLNTGKQSHRTYFEFGSGSGQHILTQAAKSSDSFFVGVELRYKRCLKAAEKASNERLENILFFRGDGLSLMHCVEPESLDGIFILFPDPWEKRKWQKNRIMQEKNLCLFYKILKPGGTVHYRTDHQEYFESAVALLKNAPEWKVNYLSYDLRNSEFDQQTAPSEFEQLFRSQNKPIQVIEVRKL